MWITQACESHIFKPDRFLPPNPVDVKPAKLQERTVGRFCEAGNGLWKARAGFGLSHGMSGLTVNQHIR